MNALVVLVVLQQFPLDVFENDKPFSKLEEKDGVTMSRREVKSNAYFEYRAEVSTAHPVEALCAAIFEWGTKGGDGPGVTMNKVLKDGDDLRVVYNQITQPVVSNRDFAVTVARERLPDGVCRIRFRATNELAPPKPDGFVRMDKMWGEWRFEPVAAGGSKIIHTLFSDPAGAIPPFLVHGPQRKSTRDSAVMALEKTKRYLEATKGPGADGVGKEK